MARVALFFGGLLILIGIVAYGATGGASITALIPAFIGILIGLLGFLALKEHLRMHAMHGAAGVALLGLIGTIGGVAELLRSLSGAQIERMGAAVVQSITAAVLLVFLILCVRSFIDARRARSAEARDPSSV